MYRIIREKMEKIVNIRIITDIILTTKISNSATFVVTSVAAADPFPHLPLESFLNKYTFPFFDASPQVATNQSFVQAILCGNLSFPALVSPSIS